MNERNREMIRYVDTTSADYKRTYSNSTLLSANPQGDIVIDFYEENLKPLMVVERPIQVESEEEVVFNRPANYMDIERERKVSVTLSRDRAIELAKWILDNAYTDGDMDGN
jgi:hypothetical protein